MGEISFKIPNEEEEFLRWYTKLVGSQMGTVFREATLDAFRNWKREVLLNLYAEGKIGMLELCKRGNLTLSEAFMLIEEAGVEPPITEEMDRHTSRTRDEILKEIEV